MLVLLWPATVLYSYQWLAIVLYAYQQQCSNNSCLALLNESWPTTSHPPSQLFPIAEAIILFEMYMAVYILDNLYMEVYNFFNFNICQLVLPFLNPRALSCPFAGSLCWLLSALWLTATVHRAAWNWSYPFYMRLAFGCATAKYHFEALHSQTGQFYKIFHLL